MRRLSSPSRRFSNYNFKRRYYLGAVPLCAAISIWACKARDVPERGETSQNEASTPLTNVTTKPADAPLVTVEKSGTAWLALKDGASSEDAVVGWMEAGSCFSSELRVKARLNMLSFEADVEWKQEWSKAEADLTMEGQKSHMRETLLPEAQRAALCEDVRKGSAPVTMSTPVAEALKVGIQRTLVGAVGDCKAVEWLGGHWHCQVASMMPQSALVELEQFQQAMIRKWSRQPYILARRAGVTTSLAKLASRISSDDGMRKKFCKMVQYSLPEELPLILTSSRWQKAMCEGGEKVQREAAYFALAKAIDELSMLRQLYESTSRVGIFSLKIPDRDIPGRTLESNQQALRVTIVPDTQVTESLVHAAEHYLGRGKTERGRGKAKVITEIAAADGVVQRDVCWHPIFSDTSELLRIANGMRLTGAAGFRGECEKSAAHDDAAEHSVIARYLLQSLASETEFVMDNGQSKLLRLPEGQYSYMIQVLPQNPVDAEEAIDDQSPQTHGELGWGQARNHAIRTW